MTANADIQTDVRQNALMVPSSAIKTQNGKSNVLVPQKDASVAPQRVAVETGISNDTSVEIIFGLTEGQQIVVRTVNSTATTNTANQNSFGGPGMRL